MKMWWRQVMTLHWQKHKNNGKVLTIWIPVEEPNFLLDWINISGPIFGMAKSVFKSRDKIIGGALLFIIINAGLFYHFRRLECYFKPQPREKHLIWALIGASFLLFFFWEARAKCDICYMSVCFVWNIFIRHFALGHICGPWFSRGVNGF